MDTVTSQLVATPPLLLLVSVKFVGSTCAGVPCPYRVTVVLPTAPNVPLPLNEMPFTVLVVMLQLPPLLMSSTFTGTVMVLLLVTAALHGKGGYRRQYGYCKRGAHRTGSAVKLQGYFVAGGGIRRYGLALPGYSNRLLAGNGKSALRGKGVAVGSGSLYYISACFGYIYGKG